MINYSKNVCLKSLFVFFILIFCINAITNAQTDTTTEQLAAQYYQNKEYDKAIVLYEQLFTKKQDYIYYAPYLDCLIRQKEFKTAEKMIKKQIRIHPSAPQYSVDLGYLYNAEDEKKAAKAQYDNLIKNMLNDKQSVIDLANAFLLRDETDYAILTYTKASKASPYSYPFSLELADIYNDRAEYDKMMNEYVGLIEYNTSYLDEVEGILQTIIAEETDTKKSTALRNVLLKKINDYPNVALYSELLLWYSMQMKDFDTALVQAEAIYRRDKKDEGKSVIGVARLAASNEYYDIAIKAYQFLIDKGANNYYYMNSKIEILDVKYSKITTTSTYTKEDIVGLEKEYKAALLEFGKYSSSIPLIIKLAHLEAFYLDSASAATKLLYEALEIKSAKPSLLAECKIELADILLMTGEIWEATLLYSQVDKAFKDEPIGHLAKLKNAKLSYYIGEFEWAKAQLDVLKAATSKLIANDAMALSLLISDNSDLDTTYEALAIYARADLSEFRHNYDDALQILDSLFIKFKYHSLFDEAYNKKAEIYIKKGMNDSAVIYYKKIIKEYPYDILGDDATYKLAVIYEDTYKDTVKAMELYEKLMADYPGSTYVVEARKRYRALRGDVMN